MDWDTLRNSILLGNTLITAVIGLVLWLRKPGEESGRAVSALKQEMHTMLEMLKERTTRIEERQKHTPTTTDLAELEGLVKRIEAQNTGQTERLSSVAASVARIEHFLLSKS